MQQITINILDNSKIPFFIDLMKSLNFVNLVDEKTEFYKNNEKIKGEIKQGLIEIKLIEQDKLQSKSLTEFLNEL